jgi:hypothetical protein
MPDAAGLGGAAVPEPEAPDPDLPDPDEPIPVPLVLLPGLVAVEPDP